MSRIGPLDLAEADRMACATLWRREIVRFVRQRSRIMGALGTPLVFWLIAGAGFGSSLHAGDDRPLNYFQFSFPGALAAILLFTSIFSTISLIDDRREGFMQGVLVAPCSRMAIALGKVLGGVTLAVAQSAVFLILAPFAGIPLHLLGILASLLAMILIAIGTTSLGLLIAWKMDSTQGFHAIMNLLLMPMLVLSGAFFPPSGSHGLMRLLVAINPMTYGIAMLRRTLNVATGSPLSVDAPGWILSIAISIAFAAIMFYLLARAVGSDSASALH